MWSSFSGFDYLILPTKLSNVSPVQCSLLFNFYTSWTYLVNVIDISRRRNCKSGRGSYVHNVRYTSTHDIV